MSEPTETRPDLRRIPLVSLRLDPGAVTATMSVGQWDATLAALYEQGATLIEVDDMAQPVAAYRRACFCGLCKSEGEP